ncbi:DUF2335 domain-containing protein [Pinibacter aurantiacus]|uniref:DUF2335 domain-containing protein n=1 Tax=Pinibacter aurantiacus TaxID=2851599 RepID=A0A9E2SBS5_9BACT|nr:DUF2335 domain-containing protein [Pinibacter aurantiacus]MBV4358447.1 DUF2335 domain-containing protein [Pinibacter aurantiacus]
MDRRESPIPNQQHRNPEKNGGVLATHMQYHQGPIPPASELQRYNEINPGFADRIISMAEREQKARLELNLSSSEKVFEIEKNKVSITKRGQWFALVIVIFILLFASFVAYLGYANAAAGLVGAVVVGVIVSFVGGKKREAES